MKRAAVVLIFSAWLYSPSGALAEDARGSREATAEEISAIREAMQDRLKDADSAKFRNVRVIGKLTVCGEVNAKNGMGGYTGYAPFNAAITTNRSEQVEDGLAPGKSRAAILAIDSQDSALAAAFCANE